MEFLKYSHWIFAIFCQILWFKNGEFTKVNSDISRDYIEHKPIKQVGKQNNENVKSQELTRSIQDIVSNQENQRNIYKIIDGNKFFQDYSDDSMLPHDSNIDNTKIFSISKDIKLDRPKVESVKRKNELLDIKLKKGREIISNKIINKEKLNNLIKAINSDKLVKKNPHPLLELFKKPDLKNENLKDKYVYIERNRDWHYPSIINNDPISISLYKLTSLRISKNKPHQFDRLRKFSPDSLSLSNSKESKGTDNPNIIENLSRVEINKKGFEKKLLEIITNDQNGWINEPKSSIPHLPDCSKKLKRIPVLLVSTLDGRIIGLNYQTGEVLWSHETNVDGDPLLSSSVSKLEVVSHGEWVRLIPSLDGGIYKFDGENVEALPITADTLLSSSFKYNEETIFSGGKFNEILGVDPQTGEIKYICNSRGCPKQRTTTTNNDQILVIKRVSQTVRAIDPKTGNERWNFNVGRHELNIANGGCESSFEGGDMKSSLPSLHIVLPKGLIAAIDKRPQILWQQKLPSPIVSAWSLVSSQLHPINLFSGPSIPALIMDVSSDELDTLQITQTNSNLGRQATLYIGVHQQQMYIQRNAENPNKVNSALKHFISPRSGENGKGRGGTAAQWKSYLMLASSYALATPHIANDHPFLLNYDQKTEVTSELVIKHYLDNLHDHGYYLFSEHDETAFLNDDDYSNVTNDEQFEENSVLSHIDFICFEISFSLWWKIGIGFVLYGVIHILYIRYLIARVVDELRLRMRERVSDLTATILQRIFAEQSQVRTIIQRMGIAALPLPSQPSSGENGEYIPIVSSTKRQDSNFSSRYSSDFEPVRCLGKGGFGVVFQVKNKLDENEYAIKRIVLPSRESSAERVKREVRALAKLNHNNIVRYYNSWLETPPVGWEQEADAWWKNSDALSQSLITSPNIEDYQHFETNLLEQRSLSDCHSLFGVVDRLNSHLKPGQQSQKWTDEGNESNEWSRSVVYDNNAFEDSDTDNENDDEVSGKNSFIYVNHIKKEDSFEVCFDHSAMSRGSDESNNGNYKGNNFLDLPTTDAETSHVVDDGVITGADFSRLACKMPNVLKETFDNFASEDSLSDCRGEKDARSKRSLFASSTHKKVKLGMRRLFKSQVSGQGHSTLNLTTTTLITDDDSNVFRSKGIEKLVQNLPSTPNPRTYLYIQMELCQKESLKDWLFNHLIRNTEELYSMFNEIVLAVEYVHDRSLMHRDLKPSNIFFSLDGEIKIGDFGLVTTIDDDEFDVRTPVVGNVGSNNVKKTSSMPHQRTLNAGTQLYMSPEQMTGLSYTYKVDVFSLGLIFFEMLVPFSTEMERRKVMLEARDNTFPAEFSTNYPDVVELLKMTLHRDPNQRPTTRGIRAHQPLVVLQKDLDSISPEEHFHLTRTKWHNRSHSASIS